MPLFRMSKELITDIEARTLTLSSAADQVTDLASVLRDYVDTQNEAFSERSEKWQDSDRGQETQDWLNELEELAQSVEQLAEDMAEVKDALTDIETEPDYSA